MSTNEDLLLPLDSLKTKNTKDFTCFFITPNNIENEDWKKPGYIHEILKKDFCSIKTLKAEPIKYMESIAELLDMNNYENPIIEPHIIGTIENYMYEIIYVIGTPEEETDDKKNGFGDLINLENELIYGNVIIQKVHIPVDSEEMNYVDVSFKDIEELMYNRVYNKVVLYEDDEFKEERICDPIKEYADKFFGEGKHRYKQRELPFLKHNLNIWYLEDKYSEKGACGKLLDENIRIEKCIFFTMRTNHFRGNISLNEINKIIYLSKVLDNYKPTPDMVEDKKDDIGRIIVKNKYRLLEKVYQDKK